MSNPVRDYLVSIGGYRQLTADEELELGRIKDEGETEEEREKARQTLIKHNLKLVVKVAKDYKSNVLTLLDFIQEGNVGLIMAVDKYNYKLGYRFSTCAVPWIQQQISKSLVEKGRAMRLPANIYQKLSKYRKVCNALECDGVPLTKENIAHAMSVKVEEVEKLQQWKAETLSLDTPLGEEGEDTLADLQADKGDQSPTDYTEQSELHSKILKLLEGEKERTRQIIKLRYGIWETGDPEEYKNEHTLEEIGAYLGITRERVRQIEKQTLANFRVKWDLVKERD